MKTDQNVIDGKGEGRFRELVEQSSDWIWEVDESGVYTYSSPGVRGILGYEPSEVVGKNPFAFMPPDESRRVSAVFVDLVLSRQPIVNFENVNLRKDGSRVVLETSGVPVFDAHGEFRGYRGMDRDITGRKEAEEKLRRIGENLAEAQRIAHLGSWEWDIEGNRLSWSDEMYRIFGVDPRQFGASFEAFLEAVHPDDREDVRKAVDEALNGQHFDIEYRVVKANGEIRNTHAQGEVSFNGQGKPSRMLGTVLDITERKRIESELRLFRTLIDNSNDAIEVLDRATFHFHDMNEKGCRDLGYSREEILGMSLWDIDPGFGPDSMDRMEAQLGKTGGAVFESRHRRKDGSSFPVEISIRQVELDQCYVLAIVRDISERKRIEQEMMHYAEDLKHSNEQLRLLATTDMLTGISNRRKFHEMLERELSKAKRYGTPFSLIMYDIDRFKQVNDLFGHDAGDEVLKTVTGIVSRNIRTEDMHARWGGEEFMILTPETGVNAVRVLAEKLRLKIASHPFGQVGNVTVSFGLAQFEAEDDAASLARKADEALYLAKENGRNRVECAP